MKRLASQPVRLRTGGISCGKLTRMNHVARKACQESRGPSLPIPYLIAIILFSGCSPSDAPFNPLRVDPDLKRGPYVQAGDTETMLVIWQTFPVTGGAVEFGLTDALGMRIEAGDFGTTHSLLLRGLQPNTYYYYRVLDGDRPLSEIARFHTNHAPNDTDFSFLVLGDSGFGSRHMFYVAELVNASAASFGLHTGDVVYRAGEEQFYDARFFYPFAQFLATNVMYPSLGNHDLLTDDGAAYLRNFYLPENNMEGTERYYSFDYGHAHFVALDTNQSSGPGSAQRTWLEQDLATSTKPWKFVFFHHPPYSAGISIEGDQRLVLENSRIRRDFVPLFEAFGVNIVFSGHSHSYERTFPILQNQAFDQEQEPDYVNPSGPVYIVTGGGGGPLTALEPRSLNARAIAAYHFVEISLSNKELIGRAVGLQSPTGGPTPYLRPGVVIDEFRIEQK